MFGNGGWCRDWPRNGVARGRRGSSSSRDSYVPVYISSLSSATLQDCKQGQSLSSRLRAFDHVCASFAVKSNHPETLPSRDSYVPRPGTLMYLSISYAFPRSFQLCCFVTSIWSIVVKQIKSCWSCMHIICCREQSSGDSLVQGLLCTWVYKLCIPSFFSALLLCYEHMINRYQLLNMHTHYLLSSTFVRRLSHPETLVRRLSRPGTLVYLSV